MSESSLELGPPGTRAQATRLRAARGAGTGPRVRASRQMYKLLVDRAADVIWTTDLELRYTFISPSVMRLRGYTVDEVMLQDIRESLVPASFELVRKTWAQVMERERMGLLGASWSHIIELE